MYAVNAALDKPEDLANKFQAFYRVMESELRDRGHVQVEERDGLDTSGLQDPEPVGEKEEEANETRIRDVLETIESTLCTLLYDRQVLDVRVCCAAHIRPMHRLFLPSTSDDASHNEALSSRIAALNMLDLGLEHLDIDIGDANHAEVNAVVRTCGQSMSVFTSPRSSSSHLAS